MVYPHTYRTEHSETLTTNCVYGDYYASRQSRKIAISPALLKILQYIDSNRAQFLENIKEAVKIRSVSNKLKYRDEIIRMIRFTEEWLNKLNVKYECFNIGFHDVDGTRVRLPPVILASVGNDPKKKTVCAYLHLDVPEPDLSTWIENPWDLTQKNNTFYGCGTCCGKGPLLMWFHVVEAFQNSGIQLPVNIKFVIESMHHQKSRGLAAFLATKTQIFFYDVYNVVICESEWIGEKYPCLIYGCVGILHFEVSITKSETSSADIREDMEKIVANLTDAEGNILIRDFNEYVEQITPDEEIEYENIRDFDCEEIRNNLPEFKRSWDKVKLLMSFWRLPSIILHDTLECICDKKDYSKIKKIFTLKIVPRQVVDQVEKSTKQHIRNTVKELKIENNVTCELMSSTRPWFENFRLPCYNAARRACRQIYKEDPNMIREARARQAVTIFDRVLEKNIVMLPLSCRGSNPGEPNENISSRNFYEGTKLIAAYLFQMSNI
ncbi:cytosolic non-specific dipeptidase-like [Cylas formicarius]|uniref:cytosolic non-specific dipeptidase-like n=1 Tax=Cylas formicarius TaxID=197179 RepID=UPI002958A24F|nr:cytosolic non-specific dipeptidase-like [Cylas formicarius]